MAPAKLKYPSLYAADNGHYAPVKTTCFYKFSNIKDIADEA